MRDMNRAAVVLFCGNARQEERQKRLPHRFLATLHDWLRRAVSAVADAELLIAACDGGRLTLRGACEGDWPAGPLDEQIERVLSFCFGSGYRRVVLLAGDVPATPRIADALIALDAAPAVVGLSGDGGFYLAAFREEPGLDWRAILGDRKTAGRELIARLRDVAFLPTLDDIDSREDAERLLKHAPAALASRLVPLLVPVTHPPQRTTNNEQRTTLPSRAPPAA